MIEPGDVVTADFPGVTGVKRRPYVVVSSNTYQQTRPDVIPGLLTSQVSGASQPSDYVLQHWNAAGLRKPSAFRAFLFTLPTVSTLLARGRKPKATFPTFLLNIVAFGLPLNDSCVLRSLGS